MTVEEIKVVLRIELEKSFRYIKHIQLHQSLQSPESPGGNQQSSAKERNTTSLLWREAS